MDPDCNTASTSSQVAECNGYPKYDPYSSSTASDAGYTFDLGYGKGEASGEYLLDTFSVAGMYMYYFQVVHLILMLSMCHNQ